MRFHITSIKVDVTIDGWNKTIEIDDRDVMPLRNLEILGNGHKEITLDFCLLTTGTTYRVKLPVTLNVIRGIGLCMELPSKVLGTTDDRTAIIELKNPSFCFVSLDPVSKTGHIIPVHNLVIPVAE